MGKDVEGGWCDLFLGIRGEIIFRNEVVEVVVVYFRWGGREEWEEGRVGRREGFLGFRYLVVWFCRLINLFLLYEVYVWVGEWLNKKINLWL